MEPHTVWGAAHSEITPQCTSRKYACVCVCVCVRACVRVCVINGKSCAKVAIVHWRHLVTQKVLSVVAHSVINIPHTSRVGTSVRLSTLLISEQCPDRSMKSKESQASVSVQNKAHSTWLRKHFDPSVSAWICFGSSLSSEKILFVMPEIDHGWFP